jgi:hypothetical protein
MPTANSAMLTNKRFNENWPMPCIVTGVAHKPRAAVQKLLNPSNQAIRPAIDD